MAGDGGVGEELFEGVLPARPVRLRGGLDGGDEGAAKARVGDDLGVAQSHGGGEQPSLPWLVEHELTVGARWGGDADGVEGELAHRGTPIMGSRRTSAAGSSMSRWSVWAGRCGRTR